MLENFFEPYSRYLTLQETLQFTAGETLTFHSFYHNWYPERGINNYDVLFAEKSLNLAPDSVTDEPIVQMPELFFKKIGMADPTKTDVQVAATQIRERQEAAERNRQQMIEKALRKKHKQKNVSSLKSLF